MVHRIRRTLGWVGAALWLLLPIVGIVVLTVRDGAGDTSKASVVWTPVGRASAQRSQPVSLQLTVGSTASIFAPPGLSGLVDSVAVQPGAHLTNGASLASIGGIQRLGVVSDTPFSRPLQHGSQGADVAALNAFLRSRSLSADAGDWFGYYTERGVVALAKQIGASATGSPATDTSGTGSGEPTSPTSPGATGPTTPSPRPVVFDPSWFVFIPRGATTVAKVNIEPGMSAPAPGSPIFELTPTLTAATWTDPAGSSGGYENAAPNLVPGAVLMVNGKRVMALTQKTANATGLVGPRALARLAAVLPPDAQTADGVVVSAAPAGSATVSVAAIYTDEGGQSCVRWRNRESNKAGAAKVSLVDSIAGDAIVTGLPSEATQVQVNPQTSLRQQCS